MTTGFSGGEARVTCSTWRLPQLSANQLPQGMQLLKPIGRPDPEAEGCRCDDRSRKGKKGRVEVSIDSSSTIYLRDKRTEIPSYSTSATLTPSGQSPLQQPDFI
ncbi:hypothetical protein Q7C36_019686 [Tachysurus vachellii]|uniref:Uncharacterized protein n=1 Tax=Tachysurus vachellii TaxID=175792 RepID=A0AA88LSK6_TACVA|nr:hypothetical protein Q7C36_019686 [Tachysurus vachellii]